MIIKTILTISLFSNILFFSACSKDMDEYNKPAMYWYTKLLESVSDYNLDKADDYYSSLQGEHIGSPLLPEATMMLAIAHMENEEYILTEHFLDEYIKRYANDNEKEYALYVKIKAKYLSLPNPRRNQVLVNEAIDEATRFENKYSHSMYLPLVKNMLTRLYLGRSALNKTISDLYIRLDKPKSSEYYKNLNHEDWIKWDEIQRAKNPWYREWFEGDGTSSWYGFLIPDTQSVVSRNSNNSDDEDYKETNTTKYEEF